MKISGVLLIYHHPLYASASTIMEHVDSFEKHSEYKVWSINTELGFPEDLGSLEFDTIVLHYSLFGSHPYTIGGKFYEYIQSCKKTYKIVFFQDEYRFCIERFSFINKHEIDCIFTCLEDEWFDKVYAKFSPVKKIISVLTGYVSPGLVEKAKELCLPEARRDIDISYRGRELDYYMGRGAQEKAMIGREFLKRALGLGLKLDIKVNERSRIYGDNWLKFLARSKAVLGVESGVSIFDLNNEVYQTWQQYMQSNPQASFEDCYQDFLHQYEGNIYLRTISPRHFEAAALRVAQILFEGKYSGIMKPYEHYIPLKKDFSNFDEVVEFFNDEERRQEMTENAYRDLIASGDYCYRKFVREQFDQVLREEGFASKVSLEELRFVNKALHRGSLKRKMLGYFGSLRDRRIPGKELLRPVITPVLNRLLPDRWW